MRVGIAMLQKRRAGGASGGGGGGGSGGSRSVGGDGSMTASPMLTTESATRPVPKARAASSSPSTHSLFTLLQGEAAAAGTLRANPMYNRDKQRHRSGGDHDDERKSVNL